MKLLIVNVLISLAFYFTGCPPKPSPGTPTPTPTATPTPIPHAVKENMELVIRDPLVVDSSSEADRNTGAFGIKSLLTNMAPPGKTAKDMMLSLFANWATVQRINQPFKADPRPEIVAVLNEWRRKDTGSTTTPDDQWNMNFANAPFRLLAIVNRLDLRKKDAATVTDAGEGRFVYGILAPNGDPTKFTMIFEYEQPAKNPAELARWANAWHQLGTFTNFDAAYIDALKQVTNMFAGRNAAPAKPNGSALNQIRTNSFMPSPWELRELHISPQTGLIVQAMTRQAPDNRIRGTAALADYINMHAPDIIAGRHEVPQFFPQNSNAAFRGVSSEQDGVIWTTPTRVDPKARQMFAFNTCNGCHTNETGNQDQFFHIHPRAAGAASILSNFMRIEIEIDIPDPNPDNPGGNFKINEMLSRARILACEANDGPCDQTLLKQALDTRAKRVH